MLLLMELLLPLFAIVLIIGPVIFVMKKGINKYNAKRRIYTQVSVFFGVFLLIIGFTAVKAMAVAETSSINGTLAQGLGFIAAALATGASSFGAGLAVSNASSAAIGAISENSDNFGKAIIFVALGEGVAIYGLLISILIINKL